MVFGIILILLGIIGAHLLVVEKIPASKKYVDILCSYRDIIGAIGMVAGVLWAFDWLIGLRFFSVHPIHGLLEFMGVLLMLALGNIFGLDFVLKDQKGPPSAFFIRLGVLRARMLQHEAQLAQAAMVVGLLYFLVSLF